MKEFHCTHEQKNKYIWLLFILELQKNPLSYLSPPIEIQPKDVARSRKGRS